MSRDRSAPRRSLVLSLGVMVAVLGALLMPQTTTAPGGAPTAYVSLDRTKPLMNSRLGVGTTLTQDTLQPWGNGAAESSGSGVLRGSVQLVDVQIMGFGVANPDPRPGDYDWSTLDARLRLVQSLGATPVITLFAAPTWMVDPRWTGGTNWQELNASVLPSHVQDFAELARQIALRYPFVHYFQVWNELKGLWSYVNNNWDMAAYTSLYNAVYEALKGVNTQLQVGGPYLPVEGTGTNDSQWAAAAPITSRNRAALEYWLEHARGADFIAVDRSVTDVHDHTTYTPAQQLALAAQLGSIVDQIRTLTPLPIWFSELHAGVNVSADLGTAEIASMLFQLLTHGASVALGWGPEQSAGGTDDAGTNPPLFTSTRRAGGGTPLPLASVYRVFRERFGPGTRLYDVTSTSPTLLGVASDSEILLINQGSARVTVQTGDGHSTTVPAYGTTVVPSGAASQGGNRR